MTDNVLAYLIQFGAITAGAMGLSEFATIAKLPYWKGRALEIGVAGKTRKRYNAWLYATLLGALGTVADLVVLPGDAWYQELAGLLVLSTVCVAAGHLVHLGGKTAVAKIKG